MAGLLSIKIVGIDKILKSLSDLDKVKIPKALSDGLDGASKFVLSTMRSNTPVDTGNLKDSERIVRSTNRAEIGPDTSMADYAYYVERGHHSRSGSWVPGQFYVLRTAIETRQGVLNIFQKAIKQALK